MNDSVRDPVSPQFDTNGDGCISLGELRAALKALLGERLSQEAWVGSKSRTTGAEGGSQGSFGSGWGEQLGWGRRCCVSSGRPTQADCLTCTVSSQR